MELFCPSWLAPHGPCGVGAEAVPCRVLTELLSFPSSQPPRRAASTQQQERSSPKHQQRHKREREGKWHKHGGANGRHVANVEIEWGPLPLDPKY